MLGPSRSLPLQAKRRKGRRTRVALVDNGSLKPEAGTGAGKEKMGEGELAAGRFNPLPYGPMGTIPLTISLHFGRLWKGIDRPAAKLLCKGPRPLSTLWHLEATKSLRRLASSLSKRSQLQVEAVSARFAVDGT